MPSKVKTYTILISYCLCLVIIAILFIVLEKNSNLFARNYSSVFLFLFASVFLLMVSCLRELILKEKNIKIDKILYTMSILISCIGLVVAIINLIK